MSFLLLWPIKSMPYFSSEAINKSRPKIYPPSEQITFLNHLNTESWLKENLKLRNDKAISKAQTGLHSANAWKFLFPGIKVGKPGNTS